MMKKLLFIPIALIAMSCSSDDGSPTSKKVEVLDYSYEHYESTGLGHRFEFTATVKNNKETTVTGDVKFTIPHQDANGASYAYLKDVVLTSGETKTVTEVTGSYFENQTINISKVEFVED